MSDFPAPLFSRAETITPWSLESIGQRLAAAAIARPTGTGTWPAAKLAIYVPFVLRSPITVTKMFSAHASSSGNIDIGIYGVDGTRLVSKGSTAMAGTNTLQIFDVTDTYLAPGDYFLAIALDNNTAIVWASALVAGMAPFLGIYIETLSDLPLPATATFAIASALLLVPLFGLTTRTVI